MFGCCRRKVVENAPHQEAGPPSTCCIRTAKKCEKAMVEVMMTAVAGGALGSGAAALMPSSSTITHSSGNPGYYESHDLDIPAMLKREPKIAVIDHSEVKASLPLMGFVSGFFVGCLNVISKAGMSLYKRD